jgi:hypothetical protein
VARKKENDMRALKRATSASLRLDTPLKRQTIIVYDKACIDFDYWLRAKQSEGVYLITPAKDNTAATRCGNLPWDREDPINAFVIKDEQVGIAGRMWRRVTVAHVVKPGESVELLTTLTDTKIPPGLIAEMYRRRWDIERVFKVLKHKFGEHKAWATSATAKEAQGHFVCLAHNLTLGLETQITIHDGVRNIAEEKRRTQRSELRITGKGKPEPLAQPALPADEDPTIPLTPPSAEGADKAAAGSEPTKALKEPDVPLPDTHNRWQKAHPSISQSRRCECAVKFLRWIAGNLFQRRPWPILMARLTKLYATL